MRTILVLVALAATLAAAADATSSKRFVSKRYSYSVVLPAAWTSSPASMGWKGGPPFQDPPEVDLYDHAADGRSFAIAARKLPTPTTTLRQWAAAYCGPAVPAACKKARGYRATTLGGVPALASGRHCEVQDTIVDGIVPSGQMFRS